MTVIIKMIYKELNDCSSVFDDPKTFVRLDFSVTQLHSKSPLCIIK